MHIKSYDMHVKFCDMHAKSFAMHVKSCEMHQARTQSVGEERLRVVIQMLRDFAQRWYHCCAKRRPITKKVLPSRLSRVVQSVVKCREKGMAQPSIIRMPDAI
jgi:hypothetical protein